MRTRGYEQRKPWQRLDIHDGLLIEGVEYRVARSDRDGQLLYETARPAVKAFHDHHAWDVIRTQLGFKHDKGLHGPSAPKIRDIAGVEFISDIPSEQIRRMRWLEDLVIDLERRRRAGETTLNPALVQELLDGEMGQSALQKLRKRQLGESSLGGRPFVVYHISATALLKKRRDYLANGFAALRDGRHRSGNREAKLQPEVVAIIAVHLAHSISNPSATDRSIHDDIRDEIEERNEKTILRAAQAEAENSFFDAELLRVPDIKTIRVARAKLDPFQREIGRRGVDVAVQLHPAVRGKPDTLGPLDRVEYDESIVDAITLLTESGAWVFLTDDEKKLVKRVRMVIGVAICVATRCIVGMRIYRVGNGDETVATFRMIGEDKTHYLPPQLRDKLSWHQYGGIGAVVVDQGSSNISDEARTVLANLGVPIVIAEAGRPSHRGVGERIFRTFGSYIYSFIDARTGSNVVDRRRYRPEGRASLTIDELWKMLAIGVVGVYQQTPHQELDGRTPADEWERLIDDYGVNALPDPNRKRVSYGRHSTRPVTRYGVPFAGLSYTNPLIDYHYLHGHGPLEIAGDTEDLGAISVRIGDTWYEAPCIDPDMRGVRWLDWKAACAPQKDLAADDALKRRAARRLAKKAMMQIQEQARSRAETPLEIVTSEMIQHAERQIFGKYQHAEDDQPVKGGELGVAVEPYNGPDSGASNRVAESKPAAKPVSRARSRKGTGTTWSMGS
jgi:Integrase core domain.